MKFLDWLGRLSGSIAGSSVVSENEGIEKQMTLVGEVEMNNKLLYSVSGRNKLKRMGKRDD